jgi:hypothetical protein
MGKSLRYEDSFSKSYEQNRDYQNSSLYWRNAAKFASTPDVSTSDVMA